MTAATLISALYVFALACFLGYQVISRVPPLLHTPVDVRDECHLGISLVGLLLLPAALQHGQPILGFTAVFCSTTMDRRIRDHRSHVANV